MSGHLTTPLHGGLLSEQIYLRLREAILTGDLSPGDRVVESETARALGVSQAPVREAVRRLAQEGLLTHQPRRGNFVSLISDAETADARQVRATIEGLAVRLVCERASVSTVAQLNDIADRMRSALHAADFGAFRERDVEFHRAIIDGSQNPVLIRVWQMLEPTLRALRGISDPFFSGDREKIVSDHVHLADLIARQDVPAAVAEAERHALGEREGGKLSTSPRARERSADS